MLKAAVVLERADIGLGGAERSVSELTCELRRQGVNAVILAATGQRSEQTQVLCRPGKRTSLKMFQAALQTHFQENHYDIVHSTLPIESADIYQPRGGSYRETMLRNIASYPNPMQRWIKRSTHALNLRRFEYLRAEERLCSPGNRAFIAALSGYVKEQFTRHYGVADARIMVIGNGVNTDFSPSLLTDKNRRDSLCKALDIEPSRRCVFFLFAANNPRLKGLRPLLYAFRGTVEQSRDVYPVLVVAGSKELGTYHGLVEALDLSKHVYSTHAGDGIWPLLAACDAAVLPTYYDPCSRFILEALAMERPVITSRYNGAAERFRNGRHGIIVDEPDDIPGLTRALLYYCNPTRIELAGRAIAEDNLSQDVSMRKHVEQLIRLYEKIVMNR